MFAVAMAINKHHAKNVKKNNPIPLWPSATIDLQFV